MLRQSFSFASVGVSLAIMHKVSDDKIGAFRGRLKHYQKQGFPPGTNTGRGRAATYMPEHALKLALVTEFNQLGLSPERAIKVFNRNEVHIKSAIILACNSLRAGEPEPIFLYFDPSGLSDLQATDTADRADATFYFAGKEMLIDIINAVTPDGFSRIALINLTNVIRNLVVHLALNVGGTPPPIVDGILEYAIIEDEQDVDDPKA